MPASVLAGTQGEPRVFSASFLKRLALLTHAERELRGLGLHVIWSRLAGPIPQLRIKSDAGTSVKPLLDRATPRTFRQRAEVDGTVASCEFGGVLVSWVCVQP